MQILLPLLVILASPLLFLSQQPGTVAALPLLDRDTHDKACDYHATKGAFVKLWREAAVRDFTRLYLVEKNPKKAFDKWIPGRYTQQNVGVKPESQGRDKAIAYITELQSTPGMTYSNIKSFAGQGPQGAFGLFHFRRRVPGTEVDYAIMDLLRFTGTCFTDHWDAKNQIFGNETNPIAYF